MENPLYYIIIEDEPAPRKLLKDHLNKMPQVKLLKSFNNAVDALNFLKNNTPDIIFLDINLPGISGINFLQKNLPDNIHIIITTAHSEYALESYDYEIVHYLTKPITYTQLAKSIERVLKKMQREERGIVILKEGKKQYKIELGDIDWVKSEGCYLTIWSRRLEKGNILIRMTQKEFIKLLPPEKFSKINKSIITAFRYVAHCQTDKVILKNGESFPLARRYRSNFL